MVHGFPTQMLEELVTTGLAKASPEKMKIARKRRKVLCFQVPHGMAGPRKRPAGGPRRMLI